MNACPMGDTFDIGDPEEDIDTVVSQMKELNKKVSARVTSKGVATVVKGNGTKKQLNVSWLKPYYRLESKSLN
ncbi:hypothetical protein CesoFtcFv8_001556 [Champsocephalus esox]|uniref:Uncharacterized protein n=1 Tax=Champsocephalus esox TaxID=159716 RepID=A0AAN8D7A1_9TELE|nr:hypothetical protein CesoFtcFv8_001556 [Champsocephalus esox]